MSSRLNALNALSLATDHPLRFQDGNVIVKLSSRPSHWLLLHADVLRAASPMLNDMLTPYSGTYKQVRLQGMRKRKNIYALGLVAKDGSLFLETQYDFCKVKTRKDGTTFIASHSSDPVLFQRAGETPIPAEATAADHHAMFAILYEDITGRKVTTDEIFLVAKANKNDDFKCTPIDNVLTRLVGILCLSKHYGLLDRVAPRIEQLLVSLSDMLEKTHGLPLAKTHPQEHTMMAELLGDRPFRHINLQCPRLIAFQPGSIDGRKAGSLAGTSGTGPDQRAVLRQHLLDLERSSRHPGPKSVRALQIDSVALHAWTQWVNKATQLDGTFEDAIDELHMAAENEDPSCLFRETVLQQQVCIWLPDPEDQQEVMMGAPIRIVEIAREAAGLLDIAHATMIDNDQDRLLLLSAVSTEPATPAYLEALGLRPCVRFSEKARLRAIPKANQGKKVVRRSKSVPNSAL